MLASRRYYTCDKMGSFSDWSSTSKGTNVGADMDVPVAVTLTDYMTLARELQACCRLMTKVKGAQKLERRIGTEIKFFQTLSNKDEATQAAQLQSSNLSHFAAIVHAATHLPGVTRLMRPFAAPDRPHSLEVDVVAQHGRSWVKVVARKGQALHLVWAGQGQFGERDMVQHLGEYVECAQHHPLQFQTPRVHVAFYNSVTMPMASALRDLGVTVLGDVVPVHPHVSRLLTALPHDGHDGDAEEEGEEKDDQRDASSQDLIRDDMDEGDDDDDLVVDGESDDSAGCVEERDRHGEADEGRKEHGDAAPAGGDSTTPMLLSEDALDGSDLVCDGETATVGGTNNSFGAELQNLQSSLRAMRLDPRPVGSPSDHDPRQFCSALSSAANVPHTKETPPNHPRDRQPSSEPKAKMDDGSSGRTDPLSTSDLETDSAQELGELDVPHVLRLQGGDSRPLGEGEEGGKTLSSSAWRLSPRSRQRLGRILSACPDLSRVGEEGEETTAGDGGEGRGPGEGRRVKVNLDVTTLITLVSDVCHGGCNFRFQENVLDQQAREERVKPTLPDLLAFLHDKEWIVCRTAWSDFDSILQMLGGPGEKRRAALLLNRLSVVDDQPSARTAQLRLGGKVKERSKVVFGTGDEMHAITVTANSGFVRSAESQFVPFAVHLHPARALTELKALQASPL